MTASSIARSLIASPPLPALFFAWSRVAFNNIGLLLILVNMLIRASDSAVEFRTRLSSLSAERILLKIASCSLVGVTKTTYSSIQQRERSEPSAHYEWSTTYVWAANTSSEWSPLSSRQSSALSRRAICKQ